MTSKILIDSELRTFLTDHPEWKLIQGELARTIAFKDFVESIAFVNKVAGLAEDAAHHPDIDIRYNKVSFTLVTHDAGGITQSDLALAEKIEGELRK